MYLNCIYTHKEKKNMQGECFIDKMGYLYNRYALWWKIINPKIMVHLN